MLARVRMCQSFCVCVEFSMCWIEKKYKWPRGGRFTTSLASFKFRYRKPLTCRLISVQVWAERTKTEREIWASALPSGELGTSLTVLSQSHALPTKLQAHLLIWLCCFHDCAYFPRCHSVLFAGIGSCHKPQASWL